MSHAEPTQLTRFANVPREGETLSKHGNAINAGPDYKINPATGCWEWQKFKYRGYGKCSWKGKSAIAHRIYFELAYGPIPAGHDIHHVCKNPGCVNPEHLQMISDRMHDIESFLTDRANGLTLDDIREIRRLGRTQGYTSKVVADMFGIHWRTVDDYWGSRRWAAEFDDGPCRPVCTCPQCQTVFVSEKNRKRKYCSRGCRDLFNRAKAKELRRAA